MIDLVPAAPTPTATPVAGAPRRVGPPFGDVLATATPATPPKTEAKRDGAAEGAMSDAEERSSTADAVLAALTVARAAVDQAGHGRASARGRADGELPRGLTVARAAVAANGAAGSPGGPAFAIGEQPPTAAPEQPAAQTDEPVSLPATATLPGTASAETPDTPVTEPSDAVPPTGPAAVTNDQAVEPISEAVQQLTPAADGDETAPTVPAEPTSVETSPEGTPLAAAPPAPSAPTAPSSAPTVAPTPGTAFVGRLVDAATQLENAPAPREVVLDLRDVLGGDTSVSIRLVRGEVHVSVRGELPPGSWQRELASSLAERGFDLGSFEQRDRSAPGRPDQGDHPGRGRGAHRGAENAATPTPDPHADVRHAAGLRL